MARKKILFVSYYYPPAAGQALPGTQRSVKFIRYMNRLDKYVLTVKSDSYPQYFALDHPTSVPVNNEQIFRTEAYDFFQFLVKSRDTLVFWKSNKETLREESLEHRGDTYTDNDNHRKRSLFQKIKDLISSVLTYPDSANCWMFHAVKTGRRIIAKEDIDYIFATGKPWSALIIALFLKRHGEYLVVDFRDPWVDNPFELEVSSVKKWVDEFFEKKVVRKADTVFLNTDDLREAFVRRYPDQSVDKFVTVTNGFDAVDFTVQDDDVLASGSVTEQSDLVLTHAGMLYGLRDPIAIFKALNLFYQRQEKGENDRVIFRQLGRITLDYDPKRYVDVESEKDFFDDIGLVSYDKCLAYLDQSDILLIIQPDTKTQIPSKLFEYIYLEKPILTIAPLDGALAAMIFKYDFGNIYDPGDIEGIYQFLVDAAAEKRVEGTLRRSYANRDRFDVKNITAKFENLLLGE